ncbi:unnamed protein product [Ectocarpus fasciculatus]
MQNMREQNLKRVPKVETKGTTVWPDNTPLIDPRDMVISGQWEPGFILHACPITEVGRKRLGIKPSQQVYAITPGEGGSSAGGSSAGPAGLVEAVQYQPPHMRTRPVHQEWED